MNTIYHTPVLANEMVDMLHIKSNGIYVDATLGGGGHTRSILDRIDQKLGKIFVCDQDSDAIKNAPRASCVEIIHANFRYISNFLRWHKIDKIDGIIADLGVSSYQLDTAERGFSIMREGPLDMRMNTQQQFSATEVVNTYSKAELKRIFQEYGEVHNANTAASVIVEKRETMKIATTQTLRKILEPISKANVFQYIAKIFQAIRIEVNQELENLSHLLNASQALLRSKGRIVILSFHSLEDRIVKQCFKNMQNDAGDPIWNTKNLRHLTSSKEEQKKNKRSRSVRLRVAERTPF